MIQDNATKVRIDTVSRNWATYLHSGDATPEKVAEFEAWLAADASHVLSYLEIEQLMGDLAIAMDPRNSADGTSFVQVSSARAPVRRHAIAGGALAAVAAVAVGLFFASGTILGPADPGVAAPDIETEIAEIRSIYLEDGTQVTLGARSRLESRFTEQLRVVKLSEGEAYFDVASDNARPFYVEAGDRLIRVVGTQFAVRQGADDIKVSVVEGVVEVLKGADPYAAEKNRPKTTKDVLRAGDEVIATIGSVQREFNVVEPESAATWRRGWLVYEDASLAEIISDTNRYSKRQIVVGSPGIGDLRVTAAFGVEKIDQFIAGLEASYSIAADYGAEDKIVLRARN